VGKNNPKPLIYSSIFTLKGVAKKRKRKMNLV
jgi:hypothetical protein